MVVMHQITKEKKVNGLPVPSRLEYQLLLIIAGQEGGIRGADIYQTYNNTSCYDPDKKVRKAVAVPHTTVNLLLRRLKKKGYVASEKFDKKSRVYFLTPAGNAALQKIIDFHDNLLYSQIA